MLIYHSFQEHVARSTTQGFRPLTYLQFNCILWEIFGAPSMEKHLQQM